MTEQSILLTADMAAGNTGYRPSADAWRWRAAVRRRWTRMSKYPRPHWHLSVNHVAAYKLNGINRKYRSMSKFQW